jgi:hypothetical protein
MFAFLPFQVNARRFVIPFYVITRDINRDLPGELFTVTIKGLDEKGLIGNGPRGQKITFTSG